MYDLTFVETEIKICVLQQCLHQCTTGNDWLTLKNTNAFAIMFL